eukprot:Rhum_TRINITY_DN17126_c0_g1::Rhum_TRINITY_DN17126_c0_g1_i1::g.165337::m.165337
MDRPSHRYVHLAFHTPGSQRCAGFVAAFFQRAATALGWDDARVACDHVRIVSSCSLTVCLSSARADGLRLLRACVDESGLPRDVSCLWGVADTPTLAVFAAESAEARPHATHTTRSLALVLTDATGGAALRDVGQCGGSGAEGVPAAATVVVEAAAAERSLRKAGVANVGSLAAPEAALLQVCTAEAQQRAALREDSTFFAGSTTSRFASVCSGLASGMTEADVAATMLELAEQVALKLCLARTAIRAVVLKVNGVRREGCFSAAEGDVQGRLVYAECTALWQGMRQEVGGAQAVRTVGVLCRTGEPPQLSLADLRLRIDAGTHTETAVRAFVDREAARRNLQDVHRLLRTLGRVDPPMHAALTR